MKQDSTYSQAQIITVNPILKETAKVKEQYYYYLKRLFRLVRWDKRKYVKTLLLFYADILCVRDKNSKKVKGWDLLNPFYFLLPFDIITILTFQKRIDLAKRLPQIVHSIIKDFSLPPKSKKILAMGFSAAQGDEASWNYLLREGSLTYCSEYLRIIKKSIDFSNQRPYKIMISATMSAGKSTLMNALTGKNISLTQSMACTSKIHTIVSKPFEDGISSEFDYKLSVDASKEELLTDNTDNKSTQIVVSTFFNGSLGGRRLIVYDSPGVNSYENAAHTEIAEKMLKSKKYNLLLYVINATQLGTTDEEQHLRFVSQTLGRRKILFVLNKVDHLFSEENPLSDIIARQRDFLRYYGFKSPLICPISAHAAYLAKKSVREPLTPYEQRAIINHIDTFAHGSLREYYEGELACPSIPLSGNETDDLLINCGFAYLESIIIQYKEESTNGTSVCKV